MPVQLWDHVHDPLDVDKRQHKKQSYKANDPYAAIPQSDNEGVQADKKEQKVDQNLLDDIQDPAFNKRQELIRSTMIQNTSDQNSVSVNAKVDGGIEEQKSYHADDSSYNLNYMMNQLDQQNKILKEPVDSTYNYHTQRMLHNQTQQEIKQMSEEFQLNTHPQNSPPPEGSSARSAFSKKKFGRKAPTKDPQMYTVEESNEFVTLSDLKAQLEAQQENLQAELLALNDPYRIREEPIDASPSPLTVGTNISPTNIKYRIPSQLESGPSHSLNTTEMMDSQMQHHPRMGQYTSLVNQHSPLYRGEQRLGSGGSGFESKHQQTESNFGGGQPEMSEEQFLLLQGMIQRQQESASQEDLNELKEEKEISEKKELLNQLLEWQKNSAMLREQETDIKRQLEDIQVVKIQNPALYKIQESELKEQLDNIQVIKDHLSKTQQDHIGNKDLQKEVVPRMSLTQTRQEIQINQNNALPQQMEQQMTPSAVRPQNLEIQPLRQGTQLQVAEQQQFQSPIYSRTQNISQDQPQTQTYQQLIPSQQSSPQNTMRQTELAQVRQMSNPSNPSDLLQAPYLPPAHVSSNPHQASEQYTDMGLNQTINYELTTTTHPTQQHHLSSQPGSSQIQQQHSFGGQQPVHQLQQQQQQYLQEHATQLSQASAQNMSALKQQTMNSAYTQQVQPVTSLAPIAPNQQQLNQTQQASPTHDVHPQLHSGALFQPQLVTTNPNTSPSFQAPSRQANTLQQTVLQQQPPRIQQQHSLHQPHLQHTLQTQQTGQPTLQHTLATQRQQAAPKILEVNEAVQYVIPAPAPPQVAPQPPSYPRQQDTQLQYTQNTLQTAAPEDIKVVQSNVGQTQQQQQMYATSPSPVLTSQQFQSAHQSQALSQQNLASSQNQPINSQLTVNQIPAASPVENTHSPNRTMPPVLVHERPELQYMYKPATPLEQKVLAYQHQILASPKHTVPLQYQQGVFQHEIQQQFKHTVPLEALNRDHAVMQAEIIQRTSGTGLGMKDEDWFERKRTEKQSELTKINLNPQEMHRTTENALRQQQTMKARDSLNAQHHINNTIQEVNMSHEEIQAQNTRTSHPRNNTMIEMQRSIEQQQRQRSKTYQSPVQRRSTVQDLQTSNEKIQEQIQRVSLRNVEIKRSNEEINEIQRSHTMKSPKVKASMRSDTIQEINQNLKDATLRTNQRSIHVRPQKSSERLELIHQQQQMQRSGDLEHLQRSNTIEQIQEEVDNVQRSNTIQDVSGSQIQNSNSQIHNRRGTQQTTSNEHNDYGQQQDSVHEQINELAASIAKISNKLTQRQEQVEKIERQGTKKIGGMARRRSTKRAEEMKKTTKLSINLQDTSPGLKSEATDAREQQIAQRRQLELQQEASDNYKSHREREQIQKNVGKTRRAEQSSKQITKQIDQVGESYINSYEDVNQHQQASNRAQRAVEHQQEMKQQQRQYNMNLTQQKSFTQKQSSLKQQLAEVKHQATHNKDMLKTHTARSKFTTQKEVYLENDNDYQMQSQRITTKQVAQVSKTPGANSHQYQISSKGNLKVDHELYQQRKRDKNELRQQDLDHETTLLEKYLVSNASPNNSQKTQSQFYQQESKKILKIQNEHMEREKALLESYENKQRIISANLDQIQQLEDELREAKANQFEQEQLILAQRRAEADKMLKNAKKERERAEELSKRAAEIACQTSSKTLPQKTPTSEVRVDIPSQVYDNENKYMMKEAIETQKSQNTKFQRDVKPKRGMADASQQLTGGNPRVENPKNSLNPMFLDANENAEDQYDNRQQRDMAIDPKTRDAGLDAKARDIALDPMICEKSTDPKMHDTATDAWKRDGAVQTLKQADAQRQEERQEKKEQARMEKERQERERKARESVKLTESRNQNVQVETHSNVIAGDKVSSQGEMTAQKNVIQNNLAHGGTQYNLKEAADVSDTDAKDTVQDAEQKEIINNASEPVIVSQHDQAKQEARQESKLESIQSKKSKTHQKTPQEPGSSKNDDKAQGPMISAAAIEKGLVDAEGSMSQRDELNSRNKNSIEKINADNVLNMQSENQNTNVTQTPKVQQDVIIGTERNLKDIDDQNISITSEANKAKELPIYHDHLLEEVMEQKLQKQKSREQRVRNDSRSTQQMFEHQFNQKSGKDRFNNKRGTVQPGEQTAQIISQNDYNSLPPINQGGDRNRSGVMNQTPAPQRPNYDNFSTPKPGASVIQENQYNVSGNPQYNTLPGAAPTEMRDPNSQIPAAMSQVHQHHQHHDHDHKKKCSACIRRRTRRHHAKLEKLGNIYGQNPTFNQQRSSLPPPNNQVASQDPVYQQPQYTNTIDNRQQQPWQSYNYTGNQNSGQTMPQINNPMNNQGNLAGQNQNSLSGLTPSFQNNQQNHSNFYNSSNRLSQRNQSLPPVNPQGNMQSNQMNPQQMQQPNQQQMGQNFNHSQVPSDNTTVRQGQMPPLNQINAGISSKRQLGVNDNSWMQNPNYATPAIQSQHLMGPQQMSGQQQMSNPMFAGQKSQGSQQMNVEGIQNFNQGINSAQVSAQQSKQTLPMINNMVTGAAHMQQTGPQAEQMYLSNMQQMQNMINQINSDANKDNKAMKEFKGAQLEYHYMEKQLKPVVEKEIKHGFFEVRKKFNEDGERKGARTDRIKDMTELNKDGNGDSDDEQVQVYVSHICLHNYHPIFCKFDMNTVKIILHFSSIVYLNKSQLLYAPGFNDQFIYIVLFGKYKLYNSETRQQIGQTVNIGWTIGEEILFKATQDDAAQHTKSNVVRNEICKAASDGCVLGIEKKNLTQIKKSLYEKGDQEEFSKLEIVLRGNHLVKQQWK